VTELLDSLGFVIQNQSFSHESVGTDSNLVVNFSGIFRDFLKNLQAIVELRSRAAFRVAYETRCGRMCRRPLIHLSGVMEILHEVDA